MDDKTIASEWYINAGDAIVPDDFQPPPPAGSPLFRQTICILVLNNGETVMGAVDGPCTTPEEIKGARAAARASAVVQPRDGHRMADENGFRTPTEQEAERAKAGEKT